jgi:ABC-type iron transport system FetAB ATPase subunit
VRRLLAEQGVAALWVTHDREEAFRLGDAVWELKGGRLVAAAR